MDDTKAAAGFASGSVPKAVLRNTLPAIAAMLMVLVYNLADTFFIGQTHNDYMVAAVSLATPTFCFYGSGHAVWHGRHLCYFTCHWRGST